MMPDHSIGLCRGTGVCMRFHRRLPWRIAEYKERIGARGVVLKSSGPEAFSKLVAQDIVRLRTIVKAANLKVD